MHFDWFRSGVYITTQFPTAVGTTCLDNVACTDNDTLFLSCGYTLSDYVPGTDDHASIQCSYGTILTLSCNYKNKQVAR